MDDGATWSAPVVAIDGDGWSFVREGAASDLDPGPRRDVGAADAGHALGFPRRLTAEAGQVYVTANRLAILQPAGAPPTGIVFARSSDREEHWAARTELAEGVAGAPEVVVQGSKVAAGAGGEVLVASV